MQYLVNDGGLSHGDDSRRYDVPSIGKVTVQRSVDGNSHAPYK